jgi:hypothetical protein
MLMVGYGLIFYAVSWQLRPRPPDLGTAIYFSGQSLITLGFGDIVPGSGPARALVLAEAVTGAGVVALTISLLFSLYASFQRREALVVTLDASAGVPPSGVTLLESALALDMPELLARTFDEWRRWSAEVLDVHLAYPILNYFRSSHDNESWVSALGAVMDAATLVLTCVEDGPRGSAKIFFQVGGHLVEDLSQLFRFAEDGGAGVEREEFEEARARLAKAGYRLTDADTAWNKFSKLRGQYAGPLNELAHYLAIPPAQWIGDRSYLTLRRHTAPSR